MYRDLLINFTSFFREPEMFEALGNALARLLEERSAKVPFRIWVAGCATGEEAYSIAITAFEVLDRVGKELPIQVFATDLSETAIERARTGTYPTSIEGDVSPERLSRFFSRADSGYRVKQTVRENCVFARHDLTTDPPFSQMDLVSCRNVLIYLRSPAQQRVIPALHYGLKPGGLLILGSAETIGARSDLFDVLDSENKILVKKIAPSHAGDFAWQSPARAVPCQPTPRLPNAAGTVPSVTDVETRASRILRDLYAPPGVIIDDQMQVLSLSR